MWDTVIAILGTLGGTALGSIVTWHIQNREHEFSDRTRFHKYRLETYAQFLGKAIEVAAPRTKMTEENVFRFSSSFQAVRLLANTDVTDKAVDVYNSTIRLRPRQSELKKEERESLFRAINEFVRAARKEIDTFRGHN